MILIHILGYLLSIFGIFAIFSGIVGMFKFPDFRTKLHAASIIDSCGIPCVLVGLAFLQPHLLASFKLLLAVIFLWVLTPVASHALGKASRTLPDKNQNRRQY